MAKSTDETYAVPTLFKLMELHGNEWEKENTIFRNSLAD
jgi:hypothetical protein